MPVVMSSVILYSDYPSGWDEDAVEVPSYSCVCDLSV